MSIQLWENSSASQQYETVQAEAFKIFLALSSCIIFLYINAVMLFTLRSKPVFSQTPRYILLYNLLFAETIQLALGQLLYILAAARVYMVRYVCLIITMITIITTGISPLNLAVMSLERYVAVCYPLRHASIITIRGTTTAVAVIWAICLVKQLISLLMLLFLETMPLHNLMQGFCAKHAIYHQNILEDLDKGFMYTVFVFVGGVIICSYFGVIISARSASTGTASANKALKTVLLHMFQLVLTLLSTMVTSIMSALHGKVDQITIKRMYYVFFIFLVNLPRSLSCLIYGLRDQTIRPLLVQHLCFCLKHHMMPAGQLNKH
ncbi:odorant receptor 131-2-like [Myripristis murdjan]|uniref:odorant receptor 131-2-like n=1 Tax=Myripristis murdjan TaxID=586833 RepID=UPI001175E9F8|nr:odorant receptor 131-2-like [Myripristis murdjan]